MRLKIRNLLRQSCTLDCDGILLDYLLVRSPKRRSLSIRIDPQGNVQVNAPLYLETFLIESFIQRKHGWIYKHLTRPAGSDHPLPQFIHGAPFLFVGTYFPLSLKHDPLIKRPRVFFDETSIDLSIPSKLPLDDPIYIRELLLKLYKKEAAMLFAERVEKYARELGIKSYSLFVRDQKRIWGSCSPGAMIRLNWKLVMAPLEIIDYVVVHELCHVKVPNHSHQFWALVETVIPDYKSHRKRLREDGVLYGF